MRILVFTLILIIMISACTPVSPTEPDVPILNAPTDTPLTEGQSEEAQVANTATPMPSSTQLLTSTPLPTPTLSPTPEPTPITVRFDRDSFQQLAVVRDYFPGFLDFVAERQYTLISSTLSPDGSLLAISGCWGYMTNTWHCETTTSGFLVVLDTNTGAFITEIPLGEGWPGKTAFTVDGKSLLYSTHERKVAQWNLSTNTPGLTFFDQRGSGSVYYPDVTTAPDGSSHAAVVDKTLYVWNPSGELLFKAPAGQGRINAALSFTADGSRMTVYSTDRAGVDIYDTSDWSLVRSIILDDIKAAAISPDGLLLAGVDPLDNTAIIWNVDSGERLTELDSGLEVNYIYFNPAGDLLILSGYPDLDDADDYSITGSVYETQTWSKLDNLYSFSSDGTIDFNRDGSRMAVMDDFNTTIWGPPDEQLLSGFEVAKRFQNALHSGDYSTAASLFEVDGQEAEYLTEMGLDLNDLAGSFKSLCENQSIFCHPVHELVRMGYSWKDMVYMVRLEGPDGEVFKSPGGAHIIYLYLAPGKDGQPRVTYLPQD